MIRRQTCPICEKELPARTEGGPDLFPFCSIRCRDVDLFRWMQGSYAIVEPLDPSGIDPSEIDPESLDPDAGGSSESER